jgi:hypothetical protein
MVLNLEICRGKRILIENNIEILFWDDNLIDGEQK